MKPQIIHHPSSQTSYITIYEFTRFTRGQILCYGQENISITEPSEISRRDKKGLRRARFLFSRTSSVYRHTSQQAVNQTAFSRRTNANKDWQRALRSEVMAGRVESAFDPDSNLYRPFRSSFFFFFFVLLLLPLLDAFILQWSRAEIQRTSFQGTENAGSTGCVLLIRIEREEIPFRGSVHQFSAVL